MVAILEKSEHNVDFHPMVDFIKASPLRYALTVKPTVYVSHIRQFWSIARIETTKEGTKILATVDDILRTVTESSLRRNLKLKDEDGISSLQDMELFENLTLMGYNISPNQKFTFQKAKVKNVNDQENIQALVDKHKVIITEESIRRDLKFNDVEEVSTADPVNTAGEVVTAASVEESGAPTTATTVDVDDELSLEKTLIAINVAKPKVISTAITTPRAKGIVFHEQVQAHKPNVSSLKDKGKVKMIEPEKTLKKKDQMALDEEVARKLEAEMRAEMEEEDRIAKDKDKENRALIEE
uniref:Xylulose kinase-1 n=1 Tax=Tanacetum cinerariifolium TaxID=118510 RepID=A0A6L2KW43_TANCI|nr:hypothetical protein [Tanacetum cinerariifolium]